MEPQNRLSGELSPDADAGRIVEQLRLACLQRHDALSPALKSAVTDYALGMKARGFHAEHVVILINQAIDNAGLRRPEPHRNSLIKGVVTYSIVEFYRTEAQ